MVARLKFTDLKFDVLEYSLYSAMWVRLAKEQSKASRNLSYSKLRILTAIDALDRLYGWRAISRHGYSLGVVVDLTGFSAITVRRYLVELTESGYLIENISSQSTSRAIRMYELTKTGKTEANKLSGNMDKVNERMLSYLYGKKLLR